MPLDRLVEIIRDSVGDAVWERVTRPKYGDAEHIALSALDKRIDALKEKAKPTQKDTEQVRLLHEIKSEIQQDLDERWQNRPVPNWADRQK